MGPIDQQQRRLLCIAVTDYSNAPTPNIMSDENVQLRRKLSDQYEEMSKRSRICRNCSAMAIRDPGWLTIFWWTCRQSPNEENKYPNRATKYELNSVNSAETTRHADKPHKGTLRRNNDRICQDR